MPTTTIPTAAPPPATFPARAGERWIETLSDGSHVLVPPIRPEDRERESDFIARLSPTARHFRVLGEIREASPALLDQRVNLDFSQAMAYAALAHDNGVLREVGGRYSANGDAQRGECAVAVTAHPVSAGP